MGNNRQDRFVGSKGGAGVWQRIICWMPPHDLYVEPFAGRAAVFRHKRPAARSILIDTDPSALDKIGEAVPLDSDGEVARICGDGLDFLRRFLPWEKEERVLIYLDPPYPRASRRDAERDYYRDEWTDQKHQELLEVLQMMRDTGMTGGHYAYILISSYRSELYAEALRGWETDHFSVMTRGGPAEEWLWANYPRPSCLHDYRYVGQGFRRREPIRKRQRNWARMLRGMPELERRAMLAHLAHEFPDEMNAD